MSSREIAELLGARHDNVKRTVERVALSGAMTLPPLEEVPNPGPGPRTIAIYLLDKRSSLIVVAQLSPEFTARVVDRWQELHPTQWSLRRRWSRHSRCSPSTATTCAW